MDQIKTGRFIALMRKNKKLTQRQLADKLGISDKTISKWECGNGLPEVSLMMPLCEILEISVNELLSGECLTECQYQIKAEENIMNLMKEKEESKKKLIIETIISLMCISVLVVCVLVAAYSPEMQIIYRVLIVAFGIVVSITGLIIAIALDVETGTFECAKCGNRFLPETKDYVKGFHGITGRYLKCPECGEKTYCKRRLTK